MKKTFVLQNLEKDYKNLVLEITKLQIQQRKVLAEYAKKLNEVKLQKIRKQM